MTGELAHGAVAPGVLGRQRRNERGPESQARNGRQHVGLRATDLDIERDGLVEALGRRSGQPEHDLAQPH